MSSSISHLLQFRYERPAIEPQIYRKKSTIRSRPKEHFLQTNFRFVLSPHAPPAHPAMYDADTIIDWDYVDVVSLPSSDGVLDHCPICLDTPKAPKITKCGHIFCSTCILRHLSPYRTRRCPMCFDNTSRGDLRPIEVTPAKYIEVNARLEFLLLSRIKGTLTPKVVRLVKDREEEQAVSSCCRHSVEEEVVGLGAEWREGIATTTEEKVEVKGLSTSTSSAAKRITTTSNNHSIKHYHVHDFGEGWEGLRSVLPEVGSVNATFCRLVSGSQEYETEYLSKEESDLHLVKNEAIGLGEADWIPYIDEALHDLEDRRHKSAQKKALAGGSGCSSSIPGAQYLSPPTPFIAAASSSSGGGGNNKKNSLSLSAERNGNRPRGYSGGENMMPLSTSSSSPPKETMLIDMEQAAETKAPVSSDPISYFFQLSDGQYVFLHPLNMKCLMAEAEGQHTRLPEKVDGKVLEVENTVLTPELRSRYGFLKHLPLYSQVQFVELDLRSTLSEATYGQFKAEIKKRHQKRKNKERADVRQKKADEGLKGMGGLTEEELQEIKARREAVDLDGPLPWQAMLIGEEKDPNKVQQMLQSEAEALSCVSTSPPDSTGVAIPPPSASHYIDHPSDLISNGTEASTSPSTSLTVPEGRRGSFAEIIRMNGNFPALKEKDAFPPLGGASFPALGSGGGHATSTTTQQQQQQQQQQHSSSPPTTTSSPQWGGGTRSINGNISTSPPQSSSSSLSSSASASVWGVKNPLLSTSPPQHNSPAWGSGQMRNGSTSLNSNSNLNLSTTPPTSAGWLHGQNGGAQVNGANVLASALGDATTTTNASSSSASVIKKKKGKANKGVSIFSTGSQRSYA